MTASPPKDRPGAFHSIDSASLPASLREGSEQYFHALLLALPDLLFVFDRAGLFLACHVGQGATLALPPEAFIGRSVTEIFPNELGQQVLQILAQVCETGSRASLTYQIALPTGNHTYQGTFTPVTPESVMLLARDITEQVETQTALRRSRDEITHILDRVHDGFVALDKDWRYTYVNHQASVMLQRQTPADLIGRHIWTEYPEGVGQPFYHAYQRAMETQQPQFLVEQYEPWDLWFENRIYPSPDGLSIFFTDVTERKRAELSLRTSQAKLLTVTEHSPDFIVQLDLEGRIQYVNRLKPDYAVTDVIGRNWLLGLAEDDQGAAHSALLEAIATLRQTEFEAVTGGQRSEQLRYRCRVNPVLRGEHLDSLILFCTDITEQRRLQEEHRQLELQLARAQKMESLGSLAGGVAHDMNNVLGAILGLASGCRVGQADGSPLAAAFDTIAKACDRGRSLVQSLLNFARQGLAEERSLDLNALIREEILLLERTTLQRVRLVTDLDPDLRPIQGDPSALTHALMNLCVNAVDAMPDGGDLTVRSRNNGPSQVTITLEDTGCGMPPEVLERACDPFFTTKPQGQGTGLGLSLVYGTMKAHRGTMTLHSDPGRGTRIELHFPASAPESPKEMLPAAPEATPSTRILQVLLVDDDDLVRGSLESLLELLNCAVTPATRGEEALRHIEAGLQPDVVILDMNMPGIGGAGTLQRLRELQPRVPVLLSTGRVDQQVKTLVATLPEVTVLPKPFGLKEMRAALARFRD